MKFSSRAVIAASVAAAACSSSGSTNTPQTCSGAVVSTTPNQVVTVSQADAACFDAPADGSTYIMAPQFGSGVGTMSEINYQIGVSTAPSSDVASYMASGRFIPNAGHKPRSLQMSFDYMLRQRERALASAGGGAARPPAQKLILRGPPGIGDSAAYFVCTNLNCNQFKLDTATIQYIGNNIIIFVSTKAPAGGFTMSDIAGIGNTFDQDLYPIDVNTFGAPSDIDGNGHVIVLMSPYVNAITPSNQCSTLGYVGGFFFGQDLTNAANSNHAEIFYSLVPDPTGIFSCVHTVADVGTTTLPTFIHEFQHMISWNQHVILRGGLTEETWLNEGMSHMAEELGSLYYENKYPISCGCMRTDPTQLFPDSSEGFIGGDLYNSYQFLASSPGFSLTQFVSSGSLEERGGAWLFLRWLTDLKGSPILGMIDQTSLTGVTNIETQAGEPFNGLFGDFTAAIFGDSMPGYPRNSVDPRDRYQSRNLRLLYNRLYTTSLGAGSPYPTPFPVLARTMSVGSNSTSQMLIGTTEYWKLTMPSSGSDMRLQFAPQGGGTFPADYDAQVSILHCPSASACP